MDLVTHKTLHFAHPRAVVWAAMCDLSRYQEWWPWLRSFEADALVTGDAWRCTVRPPLPYTVAFTITFDQVDAEARVVTTVTGDIVGNAELTLAELGDDCEVVVRSNLAPRSTFLRLLSTTFPPVTRYGHDWILATGAQQFSARALSVDAQDTTT